MDLETLRGRYAALLKLSMNGQADARRLQQVLGPYRASGNGSCQGLVEYEANKANCRIALGESWRVRPDAQRISGLGFWLATGNVENLYSATAPKMRWRAR